LVGKRLIPTASLPRLPNRKEMSFDWLLLRARASIFGQPRSCSYTFVEMSMANVAPPQDVKPVDLQEYDEEQYVLEPFSWELSEGS
jgi:hypothetical protein